MGTVCRELCINVWPDRDAVWNAESGGPRNHVLDGVQITNGKGHFEGKGMPDTPDDTLTWAVQKRLNRSRCRLGYGVRWPKETNIYWMGSVSPCEREIFRGNYITGKPDNTLPWPVRCAKNGWTDRDAVWVVDFGGPKEACVHGGTLAPSGECDWTVCLRRRCCLMSNYFDHLSLLGRIAVLRT